MYSHKPLLSPKNDLLTSRERPPIAMAIHFAGSHVVAGRNTDCRSFAFLLPAVLQQRRQEEKS